MQSRRLQALGDRFGEAVGRGDAAEVAGAYLVLVDGAVDRGAQPHIDRAEAANRRGQRSHERQLGAADAVERRLGQRIAAAGGVFALPLYALLQTAGDERRRARAIGANNVVNAAAMVLSAIAVILLLAMGISVPGLFLLTGVATLGVAGAFWRLRGALVPSPVLVPGEAE